MLVARTAWGLPSAGARCRRKYAWAGLGGLAPTRSNSSFTVPARTLPARACQVLSAVARRRLFVEQTQRNHIPPTPPPCHWPQGPVQRTRRVRAVHAIDARGWLYCGESHCCVAVACQAVAPRPLGRKPRPGSGGAPCFCRAAPHPVALLPVTGAGCASHALHMAHQCDTLNHTYTNLSRVFHAGPTLLARTCFHARPGVMAAH